MIRRLATLFKKELLDLLRNRAALVPIVVAAAVALAMPFSIAILVPSAAHQPLGSDAELSRISRIVDSGVLSENARVQLFLFQQFLLVFLLMPITGAMSLADGTSLGVKVGDITTTRLTTSSLSLGTAGTTAHRHQLAYRRNDPQLRLDHPERCDGRRRNARRQLQPADR